MIKKRIFDFTIALLLLLIFVIPMLLIALVIKLTSEGPALFWSERVGKQNLIFQMPKFRTMRNNTPILATHLLADNSYKFITPVGIFLRRSSLDELPQLFSILKGDLSFVGPRPALFNQDDLITQRTERQVHQLKPGLTGWAQVNGRDEIPIPEKVLLDVEYLERQSLFFDVYVLWLTFLNVVKHVDISH